MQLHRVLPEEIHDRTVFVKGPEAKHIVKVLRRGVGDELLLTDGEGRFLHTRIDRCSGAEIHAEIERVEEDPRELGAPWSTLAVALLKGDHFDLALEKGTELGVHRFVPLLADHCVVKWKGGEKKLGRWRRVVESAMKQSGRSWCPEVTAPMTPLEAIEAYGPGARVVVADEVDPGVRAETILASTPHLGMVGPEGAFSASEKKALADAGAEAVSLGPFRLRSETAAIVLAAVLNGGR